MAVMEPPLTTEEDIELRQTIEAFSRQAYMQQVKRIEELVVSLMTAEPETQRNWIKRHRNLLPKLVVPC